MSTSMTHQDFIAALPLADADRTALLATICKSGRRKGAPLLRAPDAYKDISAYAAWHGYRAARHVVRWGYLPNDCGVSGMVMRGGSDVFERVYDATLAKIQELRT